MPALRSSTAAMLLLLLSSCVTTATASNTRRLRRKDSPTDVAAPSATDAADLMDLLEDSFGRYLQDDSFSFSMSMSMPSSGSGTGGSTSGGSSNGGESTTDQNIAPAPAPSPTTTGGFGGFNPTTDQGTAGSPDDAPAASPTTNGGSPTTTTPQPVIGLQPTDGAGGSPAPVAAIATPPPTVAPSTAAPSVSYAPTASMMPTYNRADAILEKCNMTVSERSNGITLVLLELSTFEALTSPPRSQYIARTWIDDFDDKIICPMDVTALQQRYIAALFYYSFSGPGWNRCQAGVAARDHGNTHCGEKERMLSEHHECDWYGVTCNEQKEITELSYSDNNLEGELFDELFLLTKMTGVSLDDNKISGVIPQGISGWSSLQFLDLDSNQLTGTLPASLFEISSLEALDLDNNELSGEIPTDFNNLVNLVVLQLGDNLFTGPPRGPALTRMPNLVQVRLNGNDFSGGSLNQACDERASIRRSDNPAYLQFFAADCLEKTPCWCCTRCF